MSTDSPRAQIGSPSALPPGTRLGEFELLSLLGVGGFGIVYLAFDHALEREVAVKEYMPASLAGRTETMHVSLRSQSDAETFELGRRSFMNEAKLLAKFDHPSLLKVHRYWEANGTAYMAMPVLRGRTVKEVRAAMTEAPDEAWLRALLEPLLGAIEKLHAADVYHRDIAPDNIQIEPDGRPVLLDFGAARRVISDKSQALTAILKPAYAPIEQYGEAGSVRQGPWTDIYALGATLHYLLLGRPPAPATARAVHDEASALTRQALPGCSENFLRMIDWMLAPRPDDRPQSVAALREVLDGQVPPPLRRADAVPSTQWDRTVVLPPAAPPREPPPEDDDATLVRPSSHAFAAAPRVPEPPTRATSPAPRPAPQPTQSMSTPQTLSALPPAPAVPARSKAFPVLLGLGAAVVAAAGVMLWPRAPAPVQYTPEPAASAVVAAAPPPASAAVPVPAPAPVAVAPASAIPDSTIKTVVVGGGAAAAAIEATKPAPAAVEPPVEVKPKPVPKPKPPVVVHAKPVEVSPPPVVTNPVPAPAPTPIDRPRPKPDAVPASAVVAPPPVTSTAAPQGPEATCSGRNPLAYFVCMERECLRSDMSKHPDCVKWHRNARHD